MKRWTIRIVSAAGIALLAACGADNGIRPAANQPLPPAPYGARATPDIAALLRPTNQQRPQRIDDVLTRSNERQSDDFDLPPPN